MTGALGLLEGQRAVVEAGMEPGPARGLCGALKGPAARGPGHGGIRPVLSLRGAPAPLRTEGSGPGRASTAGP